MLFWKYSSARRRTWKQRADRNVAIFAIFLMVSFLGVLIFRTFAEITDDVRVNTDSELTYYLMVKEDGIGAQGVESSDTQMAYARGGRVIVTDKTPNGLEFHGFVATSDGTIGVVLRADHAQCSGKVVDDTNETVVDAGTWNNDHTKYRI